MKKFTTFIEGKQNEVKPVTDALFELPISDDKVLYVKDKKNFLRSGKDARILQYADCWLISAIWKDKSNIIQPFMEWFQNETAKWGETHDIKRALILGGGGCSFPRFLALQFPDVQIDVVELLQEVNDMAAEYFIKDLDNRDNINLITEDGIKYVYNKMSTDYDIIMVDLFNVDVCVKEMLTQKFANAILDITSEHALILQNMSVDGNAEELSEYYSGYKTKDETDKFNNKFMIIEK